MVYIHRREYSFADQTPNIWSFEPDFLARGLQDETASMCNCDIVYHNCDSKM